MIARVSFLEEVLPTPASYLQAARRVQAGELPGLRDLRVAILSTVSTQLLQPFLIVEGARWGLRIAPWFAPFGQLEEQILDGSSPLYGSDPEVVFVFARLEELDPEFDGQAAERLRNLLPRLRSHTSALLCVANFPPPERPVAGIGDAMLESSEAMRVQQANAALAAACREVPGAFVFDYARVVLEYGLAGWHDARLFALARQPWSVAAQIATARALARTWRAAVVPPAKCLVLDADNTLWGGIVGEDGLGGIALGDEYPGNVYKGFQKYLRTLRERGVLLALVSKNEEADVLAVLRQHADSILREADFAARRIDWHEKSVNVREIAAELNVALEALVLFDDNPFEREEVRRALPGVAVLDVPHDPLQFIATIEDSGLFDQLTYSVEDRQRTALYQEQRARSEAGAAASSPEEFLASLDLVATMGAVGPDTLPRVAQLLARTNQFNLTARRHSAAEIAQMMEAGAIALWLRLADRFGDHGLVGVAIARPEGSSWIVDTFLLSCRVIGRGAELALLSQLAGGIKAHGGEKLIGEYLPTARNALVARFYPSHDFLECGENRYLKRLSEAIEPPSYIRIQFHE
jgi:FkbH-like protein